MNQEQRMDFLLDYLLEEDVRYSSIPIPENMEEKQKLFERLMALRPITTFSKEFRQVYTEYLQEEKKRNEYITVSDLTPIQPHIYLRQEGQDVLKTDVVVTTDPAVLEKQLISGSLRFEVMEDFPYSNIIYTAAPQLEEEKLTGKDYNALSQCYWKCFEAADQNRCRSISIRSDLPEKTKFPAEVAVRIAVDTLSEYMRKTRKCFEVVFNVRNAEEYQIYQNLLSAKRI